MAFRSCSNSCLTRRTLRTQNHYKSALTTPNMNNVLLVQGMDAIIISISQLCDEGFNVRFTKEECIVTNEENEEVMKGVRSKDNCSLWEPKTLKFPSTCSMAKEKIECKHQK